MRTDKGYKRVQIPLAQLVNDANAPLSFADIGAAGDAVLAVLWDGNWNAAPLTRVDDVSVRW